MADKYEVKSGELKIAESPDRLIARGIGSCIAVTLYDPRLKIGGMAHVMLPNSRDSSDKKGKYADLAVEALLEEFLDRGSKKKD